MYEYNDELRAAAEQVARKKHLKTVQSELLRQKEELSRRVGESKLEMESEQADVEKLEGRTISAFFASITGKKEEKLRREKAEAYAARARYENLCYEYESVKSRIDEVRRDLAALSDCEARYERLYAQRLSAIKLGSSSDADRIFEIEKEIAYVSSRKKEIGEAMNEGRRALELANDALDHMNNAKNWNTWDMFGGGGMFTHFEKHGHLDSAQSSVEYLQAQLSRFNAELADVEIHADMRVRIDGFMRFADYFFDGIFTDLAVGDRINEGISRINNTKNEIARALDQLEEMQKNNDRREASARARIKEIVENSKA